MVPHIVRSQDLTPVNLRTIDTGVGQSIELRRVPAEAPTSTPQTPAPTRPAPAPQSRVGTVPGQTAQAAGPAALAQLRDAAASAQDALPPMSPPSPTAAAPVALAMAAPRGPVPIGSTFQIPILLSHGVDIASVPMQVQYDVAKLALVSVDAGDFLSRDGQAVALVHRDDPQGVVTINSSRPPGAAGVSGSGSVCVFSFQAKAAGASALEVFHSSAVNSAQQQTPAQGAKINVVVQ